MIKSSYHTHSNFSDGKAAPEEYVLKAIERGFSSLGFSEHGPTKYEKHWEIKKDRVEEYRSEILRLKDKYCGKIEIYCGMELDYFPGIEDEAFSKFGLDYVIGSIHYFPGDDGEIYGVDCKFEEFKKTIFDYFKGDVKAMVREFYSRLAVMTKRLKPEMIGHFDLIKINNPENKFFSESEGWYKDSVMEVLEIMAKSGTMFDVNTGGITRGYLTEPYPSEWILREGAALKIPAVLNSDAHIPENIEGNFGPVTKILIRSGYKTKMILSKGKWTEDSLKC
jgi:histidinol-phosphatase (PHP family)